ncbi:Hypothetical predicted protein, partial [Mytilus galloprovincialis]
LQGVKQGGLLSADLYKVYIEDLLSTFENTTSGSEIGETLINAVACADDVAIVSENPHELQYLVNIAAQYSEDHHYLLQPQKSVVIQVQPSNRKKSEDPVRIYINNNAMPISDKSPHLGILRSTTSQKTQDATVEQNITKSRRAAYSLMSADSEEGKLYSIEVVPTWTEKEYQKKKKVNITTHLRDLDQSTSGKDTDRDISVQGVLTTEIFIILTLSTGIVLVFGVCLCFIFYKYKSATKERKPTNNQLQIIPLPPHNNYTVEIEERLYDIIEEEYMLDDQHLQQMQMQMGSDYLDVINETNSTETSESKTKEIPNVSSHSVPASKSQNTNKNEKSSLLSSDSTSSNDEDRQETTEDYVNPYQPVLKMSPPKKGEYLTIPPLPKY